MLALDLGYSDSVIQQFEVAECVGVSLLLDLTHNVCQDIQW